MPKPHLIRTNINIHPRHKNFLDAVKEREGISQSLALRRLIDFAIECEIDNIPTMRERVEALAEEYVKKLKEREDEKQRNVVPKSQVGQTDNL